VQQILSDLGEREILRSIVPKFCAIAGDDCAIVPLSPMDLVLTTDPVPQPAAKVIGKDPDFYWMGWLLVTINCSDLAAAGAEPVAFLSAIEAPSETSVSDFERLLAGIRDACEAERIRYVGGNLREAPRIGAVGTALGKCPSGSALRRSGVAVGDAIVSVGQGGVFWRDALMVKGGAQLADPDQSPLFKPHSQIPAMKRLSKDGLVAASIDNSDGLLPSLQELARINAVDIVLDLDQLTIPELPSSLKVEPARLWLGWGDWTVVAAMRPKNVDRARRVVKDAGGVLIQIGEAVSSGGHVRVRRGRTTLDAPRIESERFAKDSWFVGGIDAYIDILLKAPLP
jgi:thiamine-monophosphate kinase